MVTTILQKKFFDKCYMSLVKMKYFNVLIDNKPFLDQPVKRKQEANEKLVEMSKNDDCITRSLLNYHSLSLKLL